MMPHANTLGDDCGAVNVRLSLLVQSVLRPVVAPTGRGSRTTNDYGLC
jgi:hypothetical protein